MNPIVAKRIVFQGQVQGVGFRYTSLRIAGHYEVSGFVKNLPDGTVEMVAQGEKAEIDNCVSDIQDYFRGYIRDYTILEIPYNPSYMDFRISY